MNMDVIQRLCVCVYVGWLEIYVLYVHANSNAKEAVAQRLGDVVDDANGLYLIFAMHTFKTKYIYGEQGE